MNPKIKLLALAAFSSAVLLYGNFLLISASALALLILIPSLGISGAFSPWTKPLMLIFIVIILFNSFSFQPLSFNQAGLAYGFLYSMRIFVILGAVFIFVQTTETSRLGEAFDFLPSQLHQVMVIALSLVPGIARLTENIMAAQKARGTNFRSPNITRTYFPVLVPLFAKTLYKSEKMALAMQARGFDGE